MATEQDPDLTGQDPMSSTAEGDHDPGTAALAAAGEAVDGPDRDATDADPDGDDREPTFAEVGPPAEAADDTPVTDAVPETELGTPGGATS